jgi:hypothetical protein
MQISAANLLATQSQTSIRSRGPVPAFEPIAFKEAPAVQAAAPAAAPATASGPAAPAAIATPATPSYGGYVRPGTNLDIKI